MNSKVRQILSGFIGASVMVLGYLHATSVPYMQPVTVETWEAVSKAPAVQTGGNSQAKLQIVFDANCPWCAKLYQILHRRYPDLAVRWIPVEYLKGDSASLAAAILASANPRASLAENFDEYNFEHHHGGYRPQSGGESRLPRAQVEFQKEWERWGGYTPMVFARISGQEIVRVAGYDPKAIEYLAKEIEGGNTLSDHKDASSKRD